jgi:hypothetical protein
MFIDRILHPEIWAYYSNGLWALEVDKDDEESVGDSNKEEESLPSDGEDEHRRGSLDSKDRDRRKAIRKKNDKKRKRGADLRAKAKKVDTRKDRIILKSSPLSTIVEGNEGGGMESWTKADVMRIWKSERRELTYEYEKRALELLNKYNGPYAAYVEALAQSDWRRTHGLVTGAQRGGIKMEIAKQREDGPASPAEKGPEDGPASSAGKGLEDGSPEKVVKLRPTDKMARANALLEKQILLRDPDYRARHLLREIDRAVANKREYMDSFELHAYNQRFPAQMLRIQIEDALDAMLRDQIIDRERANRLTAAGALDGDSDTEGEGKEQGG